MSFTKSAVYSKWLRSLSAGVMALLLAASGTVAASQPVFAVTTNQLSINDFNGKLYNVLLSQCDTNGDGTLTTSELASYTYVDLSNQSLTDLTGIEYLSGATYIDLSGNKLTSLAGLKYNYKLTYLDISDNNFTTLDSILDNSDAYVNLQELDASGNKLTDMSGAVVCSNLTTLDLSNNQLSSLSSSMVLMKKLKSLDLSNNKISSIPGLPSSLTSLSLSSNKMTDLSFASKLTALEYLDASDNLLTSVSGLPVANLETVYLDNNQLKTLGDLVGAKNCTINVSHNVIDTYTTTEQSYSETLRLSGCAVTAVPQNLIGWQYQNGAVYYFTNTTGTYVTGTTTISGVSYTFGSDGVLSGTQEKAPVEYKDPSPSDGTDDENVGVAKPTGEAIDDTSFPGTWQQSGDNWYLVDANGNMLTGWQKYDRAWYYLNDDGTMATGWLKDGDTYYYLYDWGGMATGWYKVGGSWFYSNGAGQMLANKWLEYKDEWYYLKSTGTMAKSWLELGGKWYYMNSDGVMQTGWQDIGGSTYYMSTSTGYCATGWCKIDGKTYYFDPVSCKMARNTTINGYKVDENGVYIES